MKRRTQTARLLEDDPQMFDILLSEITNDNGKRPPEVCQGMGLSWGAVLAWVNDDVERMDKSKAALEVRAHLLAEDALRIADGAEPENVSVAKLRVDTRKWVASRLNPKWYGEHTKVEHTGTVTNLMQVLSSIPTRGEIDITPQPSQIPEVSTEELMYHPV